MFVPLEDTATREMQITAKSVLRESRERTSAGRHYRIAMVAACPFPYPRGTPIRVHRLAEALSRRGHDVHVITYHLGADLPTSGLEVHRTPVVRTYNRYAPGPNYQKLLILDPLLQRTLSRVLRENPIDIVHAHHYEGLLVARLLRRRLRRPVIYDAHTMLESELPFYSLGLGSFLQQRVGRLLDRHLPSQAAHVIAVTEALRDRLIEVGAVTSDHVSVVANGVEAELFEVQPAPRENGFRYVVFAGNLSAYQGIEHMLKAFAHVSGWRAEARLLIASESSFGPYEGLASELGIRDRIQMLALPFKQLPPYLRVADVAVNPRTQCDGVPQKLMNYMAAACPIVSFEGSAVHLKHEINALVVPNGDTRGMAESMLRLLDCPDLARRLGDAAHREAAANFSWDRAARESEAVYRRVLARRVANQLKRRDSRPLTWH